MPLAKTLVALTVAAGFASVSFAQTPSAAPATPNAKVESTTHAADKNEAAKPEKHVKTHRAHKRIKHTRKPAARTGTKAKSAPTAK